MARKWGRLTDASETHIAGLRPEMLWYLNGTTRHGSQVIVNHPVKATITGDRWEASLAPTDKNEFYRVELHYLDPDGIMQPWVKVLAERLEVDDQDGEFGGGGSGWITPDTTTVALEEPSPATPWWLQAAQGDPDPGTDTGSGDLYKWVD